jgi:hypothetical protein
MIDVLFEDWEAGEIKSGITKEIYKRPPDFRKLSEAICGDCPHLDCKRWCMNPLTFGMAGYYRVLSAPLMGNMNLRRAFIILVILSVDKMRPGGYVQADIRKMAGVQGRGRRIIPELCRIGVLRKRRARYVYNKETNYGLMKVQIDEAVKARIRELLNLHDQKLPGLEMEKHYKIVLREDEAGFSVELLL